MSLLPARGRLRVWARVALATCVLILLSRYLRGLDRAALIAAARRAHLGWLVLSCVLNVPLVWCKALRMRRLLPRGPSTGRMMAIFFSSYAADNLLMSQAGVGVRTALLTADGVPLAPALGAVVLEKLIEGVALALVLAPLALDPRVPTWAARVVALGLTVTAAAGLALAPPFRRRLARPLASRWATVPQALAPLARLRAALAVTVLSLTAWLIEGAMVIAVLWALDLPAPLLTAALILLAVSAAALVPGLPANLGSFEAACLLALSGSVARAPALGFALLYHLAHTLPVTLLGLAGLRGPRSHQRVDDERKMIGGGAREGRPIDEAPA
jgi:uncharacterized membrane protein YbhN (UPF0104 family)